MQRTFGFFGRKIAHTTTQDNIQDNAVAATNSGGPIRSKT